MFANFTSSLSRYLIQADEDLASAHAAQASAASALPGSTSRSKSSLAQFTFDPSKVDKMTDVLKRYEENFSRHLNILLDTLNYLAATETVVLLSLCARLSTAAEDRGGPESFE